LNRGRRKASERFQRTIRRLRAFRLRATRPQRVRDQFARAAFARDTLRNALSHIFADPECAANQKELARGQAMQSLAKTQLRDGKTKANAADRDRPGTSQASGVQQA